MPVMCGKQLKHVCVCAAWPAFHAGDRHSAALLNTHVWLQSLHEYWHCRSLNLHLPAMQAQRQLNSRQEARTAAQA